LSCAGKLKAMAGLRREHRYEQRSNDAEAIITKSRRLKVMPTPCDALGPPDRVLQDYYRDRYANSASKQNFTTHCLRYFLFIGRLPMVLS
jgi:hypothetical protein